MNFDLRHSFWLLMALGTSAIGGCAAPVTEQAHSGFISDYTSLAKMNDTAYHFTSPRVKEYTTFMIEGPVMLFDNKTEDGGNYFSDEELEDLHEYFRARLTKALTKDSDYTVVDQAGEGVAKIRIGLTALDATVGALNVSFVTKATGAGLGGAAMEGEIVDSLTNEQLAAAVQWGSGSRVLRAGLTKLGDAKLQVNRWTDNLRKRIDEAHSQ
jgi:hypothetical protein